MVRVNAPFNAHFQTFLQGNQEIAKESTTTR